MCAVDARGTGPSGSPSSNSSFERRSRISMLEKKLRGCSSRFAAFGAGRTQREPAGAVDLQHRVEADLAGRGRSVDTQRHLAAADQLERDGLVAPGIEADATAYLYLAWLGQAQLLPRHRPLNR